MCEHSFALTEMGVWMSYPLQATRRSRLFFTKLAGIRKALRPLISQSRLRFDTSWSRVPVFTLNKTVLIPAKLFDPGMNIGHRRIG